MGTRNLTVVKLDGKVKVAQYCQWDGYPTGQGITIAEFLPKIRTRKQMADFKAKLRDVKFISSKKHQSLWAECGADDSGWVNMDVSNQFRKKYPELHRDTGAAVLELIRSGNVTMLTNQIKFLKDSTWCEYAYEIDLNRRTVKVYTGKTKPYKTYKFSKFTKQAMADLERELSEYEE
jgi:hypothetical protein